MNPLMAKAAPYAIGLLLLTLAGAGWQFSKALKRNGELEAKLLQQVFETEECVAANSTNNVTITELQGLIDEMIEGRRVEAQVREQLLVDRERELRKALARADKLERERNNEIVTNKQCLEFNSLDFSRFCPRSAEQLRLRSRGQSSDRDTDREGVGGSLQGST